MLDDNEWGLHIAKTFPIRIENAKKEVKYQSSYRSISESDYRHIFRTYGIILSNDLSRAKDVNIPKLITTI